MQTHPESLTCNPDSKNQKVQASDGCAQKKGRHPLVDEGKSGQTRLLGPVFAVIVQQIPRLGPLKLLGQRITFFSYRLDYCTLNAQEQILGKTNFMSALTQSSSHVTAQSREPPITSTAPHASHKVKASRTQTAAATLVQCDINAQLVLSPSYTV